MPAARNRLFFRIYGLLALAVALTILASHVVALGHLHVAREYTAAELTRAFAAELADVEDDDELARRLKGAKIGEYAPLVYDAAGRRVSGFGPDSIQHVSLDHHTVVHVRRPHSAPWIVIAHPQGLEHMPMFTLWSLTLIIPLIVLVFVAWSFERGYRRPFARLTEAVEAVGQGDLSARAQLERGDELGQVGRAFDEMAEKVATLVGQQRRLLAAASHELRTPLTRVRLALEAVEDAGEQGEDNARAQGRRLGAELPAIRRDLDLLTRMVEDLLTAARLEPGERARAREARLELTGVALDELAESAGRRFRRAHPRRRLEVRARTGASARLDRELILRALDNLLENAARYSDEDAPVELRVERSGERACFVVVDAGVGIPEDERAKIFEPFFRGRDSRARSSVGSGLGLSLVRTIAETHGGEVRVESAPGRGTTMRLCVALDPS